jgi:pilus assembly protein FimV
VHKSLLKLLCIVAALMLSTTVFAVGLGGINVASALGQTLNAEIALADISKSDKDSLVVGLASPDDYKTSGLEYPSGNKFKFEIQSRADGQLYIKVSSAQPVNDPFVSLLVQLTWSAGKLSREYTFLLDPPGYVPVQPAPVAVQTVAPQIQASVPAASAVPATPNETAAVPVQQSAPQSVPVAAVAAGEPTAQETPAKQKEQVAPMPTTLKPAEKAAVLDVAELPPKNNPEWLAVQRGDTMYKIAAKYKLAGMNLDRMLVALYRVNADKFDGKNMNRIRAGKILRLPTQDEYSSVTRAEAVKEIHAQAADWNAYRQKLASAASASNQSQGTQQVATGKISSSVADMAPVAKESAKEVLKLSKGEAPGDKAGAATTGGHSVSEQDKNNAAQEDAIAKDKAFKEGQKRAALLEKNLQDMKRLDQFKVEAAALAQPPVAGKAAVSAVAATSVAKPEPVAKPKVQPKVKQPVKSELSLMDQVMAEPLYLAGGAAALLLAGLGFIMYRRNKSSNRFTYEPLEGEGIGDKSGRMAAPVVPSPDTGDFTVAAITTAQVGEAPQSEVVDPISEADLFLNFGRDVQAEEILKEALQSSPNKSQILLKLLGIYANRKDKNSFSKYARQLQDCGDDAAWQQAVPMGRKLEPDNPMYGGGFRSMEDTGSATVQVAAFKAPADAGNVPKAGASALDFDFDVGTSSDQSASSPEQDFLNSAEESTSIRSSDGNLVTQGAKMDFDITSEQTLSPLLAGQGGGLDFDITSTNPSMAAAGGQEASKPAADDDGGMEFTLDFPVEQNVDEKPASSKSPSTAGFAGISLNFDDAAPSESTAENKDDNWQDVATKLDLAKAYHEMGDASGAREILEEVMREGDEEQRGAAQAIFEQLG